MALKLYNSLTRKLETFSPLKDRKAGIYSCGPTVYQYAHIGNLRTFILVDLLRRTLEYLGYKTKLVINITDVGHLTQDTQDQGEDKIEKTAAKAGKTAIEIARFYEKAFFQDLAKLNIKPPDKTPRATEHIPDQIEFIKNLQKKGLTYKTPDGIYFDTSQLTTYPRLNPQKLSQKKPGTRLTQNPYKKNPADFALWKFSPKNKQRQLEWKSPWGTGFPGWHLECSVMSAHYLGVPFDIHVGGADLKETHHPNEIAQTEGATGKILANYWLHGGYLTVRGEKMAKSEGNIYTLKDLEDQGFNPLSYRLLVLQNHYRKPMNFSINHLKKADKARQHLLYHYQMSSPKHPTDDRPFQRALEKFKRALENNLNTPQALSVLFEAKDQPYFPKLVKKTNQVLGIISSQELKPLKVPSKIKRLVKIREKLRQAGEFKKTDALRKKIKNQGWLIEDTPGGPRLTPRPK